VDLWGFCVNLGSGGPLSSIRLLLQKMKLSEIKGLQPHDIHTS
jgi:hypothetical protein